MEDAFRSSFIIFNSDKKRSGDSNSAKIPAILLSLLRRFRGIEAFYEVWVKHRLETVKTDSNNEKVNEDIRKVIDIKMKDSNELNCFILPKKNAMR